jgi:quercetin dioxygenase-like cupin family protein
MSVVHRFKGNADNNEFTWEGVDPIEINERDVEGVIKNVLVGPEDGAPDFIIRFFEVPVGGHTFFDQHDHEHGVVILHGKARVQIKDDFYDLTPLDSVFISGNEIHQFINSGDKPLGFLCVIKRMD